MASNERRRGGDRRTTARYSVDFPIEWQSSGPRMQGSISDVSFEGCFVLGSGEVDDGAPVKIFVPIGEGIKAEFSGTVANHVYEIGFGVKFDPLTAPQREVLVSLVKKNKN